MAAHGERVSGVVGMCSCSLVDEPMVQDEIPMQEQFFPQMDPEPEMGAAAAAVCDTSPSLLRNPPPIPAETARPGALDMAQLVAILAGMRGEMHGLNNKMEADTHKMDTNTNKLREEMKEMRQMGHGLQAGIMAISWSETWTERKKMAVLRPTSWRGVHRRVRTG